MLLLLIHIPLVARQEHWLPRNLSPLSLITPPAFPCRLPVIFVDLRIHLHFVLLHFIRAKTKDDLWFLIIFVGLAKPVFLFKIIATALIFVFYSYSTFQYIHHNHPCHIAKVVVCVDVGWSFYAPPNPPVLPPKSIFGSTNPPPGLVQMMLCGSSATLSVSGCWYTFFICSFIKFQCFIVSRLRLFQCSKGSETSGTAAWNYYTFQFAY